MKRTILALSGILSLMMATPAIAIDGNEYLALNESEQDGYVLGMLDALIFESIADKGRKMQAEKEGKTYPNKNAGWFSECVANMTALQLKAIFDKYLRENPEWWNRPGYVLFTLAMGPPCKQQGAIK